MKQNYNYEKIITIMRLITLVILITLMSIGFIKYQSIKVNNNEPLIEEEL